MRRTRRAVWAAAQMARAAAASLPQQMHTWKDVKAVYRLLNEDDVSFETLMEPHFQQTWRQVQQEAVVLLVQDTTQIDLSYRHTMDGVGQIGNAKGRGLLLQTVLAVAPHTREVFGCIAQKPFVRLPAPQNEGRDQRKKRSHRETDVWMQMVEQIGSFGGMGMQVHVGDRGADLFPFFRACLLNQTHFVVRVAQNRRIQGQEPESGHLLDQVRTWPAQGNRPFEVPAAHGRTSRQIHLSLSFGSVNLLPPRTDARGNTEPLAVWVVRVWEQEKPEAEDPLEWILLTSVPISNQQQAWQCVEWYRCRWIVEEYHQCLKTGCRIEHRQFQQGDRLQRLLGLLSPVAVRLLQIRDLTRSHREHPAREGVDADVLAVVAAQTGRDPHAMTIEDVWNEIARLGGYLARRRDGPAGWKTIWAGWLYVQTLLEGVSLASHLQL